MGKGCVYLHLEAAMNNAEWVLPLLGIGVIIFIYLFGSKIVEFTILHNRYVRIGKALHVLSERPEWEYDELHGALVKMGFSFPTQKECDEFLSQLVGAGLIIQWYDDSRDGGWDEFHGKRFAVSLYRLTKEGKRVERLIGTKEGPKTIKSIPWIG